MVQVAFSRRPNIVAVYDVWVESQNVNNNTSTLRRQLRAVEASSQSSYWFDALPWNCSVAGHVASGAWNYDFRPGGNQEYWLANDTVTVSHNADGTMAVWVDFYIDGGSDGLGTAASGWTITLPTIPRATTPTIPGALTAGVATTISTSGRASTAFTHTLKYTFGSATGTIATGVATSQAWIPPLTLLNQIPNDASGNGTITCETYNGTTLIGSRNIPFTLNAASNVVPTLTAPTLYDNNATVRTAIGAYVQGESLIKATVNAAGVYGSTIKSKAFSFENVVVDSDQHILASTAGTRALISSAVDSRQRSATRSDNVTVLAYTPPQITKINVYRSTAAGVADNMGTSLALELTAAIQSLIVASAQKNSMTIKVETKPRNSSTWTTRNQLTAALTYNTKVVITGGAIFDQGTSYDIRVTVSDKLKSMIGMAIVSTAVVALHLGTGLGVGKLWEQGGLDVYGHVYANGSKLITEAAWPTGFAPIPSNYALYKPSLPATSYPMGISNVFVEPDAGWPIGGAYGNVVTVKGYSTAGGTIQYWSVYQQPTATTFTDIVFYRQWFYNATSWSDWQPLSEARGGTAVRNNVYSVPTTDTARVALANRKVRWYNTDLGWEEQYYAVHGTSGLTAPGLMTGGPEAGWYPVSSGPRMRLFTAGGQAHTNGQEFTNWKPFTGSTAITASAHDSWSNSSLLTRTGSYVTIGIYGRYDLFLSMYYPNGTGTGVGAFVNYRPSTSTNAWNYEKAIPLLPSNGQLMDWHVKDQFAYPGDRIRARTVLGNWTIGSGFTQMHVEYVGPPLVTIN